MDKNEMLRCARDFEYFCNKYLFIADKKGNVVNLKLNKAQVIVHKILEGELKRVGKIRALILKGRQEGISTYIAARFYWKTIFTFGLQSIILTHEQKATDNLFDIVSRYHRMSPDYLKPMLGKSNAKQMQFIKLESGYRVATAGAKGTGRSATAQLLHGSEVAFWANANEHMAGLGQAISDKDGTEIVLETTANGINHFHSMWNDAVSGKSDYLPIFIAWFECDDYVKHGNYVSETEEEIEYQETYKLTDSQMLWRRYKIMNDFKGDVHLFNQEYPASPMLAFYRKDGSSFISPSSVDKCNNTVVDDKAPVILGFDPAEFGDDDNCVVVRKGRKVLKPVSWGRADPMHSVGVVAKMITEINPDAVMVLATGIGSGQWSRLREMFPNRKIYRVMEGEGATENTVYANKRAEMWAMMRDFIANGCELPKDGGLDADLSSPTFSYDSQRRVRIESKESMRSRGANSPDRADALAATFAFPIESKERKLAKMINKYTPFKVSTGMTA